MYTIEASTVVDRPADETFAYLADLNNLKQWDPDVLDVEWKAPAALDEQFTIVVDLGRGRRLVGDAKIVSFDPGRRIGWEARPRAPGWITGGGRSYLVATYSSQPLEGGRTKLIRRLDLEPHGLLRIIGAAMAFLARRERHAEIWNLKRILEDGAGASTDATRTP
jgi:hypothetical protein